MDAFKFAREKRSTDTPSEEDVKVMTSHIKSGIDENIAETVVKLTGLDLKSITYQSANLKVDLTQPANNLCSIRSAISQLTLYLNDDTKENRQLMLEGELTDPYIEAVTDYIISKINETGIPAFITLDALNNPHFFDDADQSAWNIISSKITEI